MRRTVLTAMIGGLAVAAGGIAWASACPRTPAMLAIGAGCTPPAGFAPSPRPDIASAVLVPHSESVVIDAPLPLVLDQVTKTALKDTIQQSDLPHVTGTHDLTPARFGPVGTRRLTCLSDGSSLVEEVLANERTAARDRFRYVVWDYTTPDARPVHFAVGEFTRRAVDRQRTETRWNYAFALKDNAFPGMLGGVGRFAFRKAFLERSYADMMKATLAAEKAASERRWRSGRAS